MRRASPEDEKIVPRISPTHFTKENSSRELEINTSDHFALLKLEEDWKIIGWALAQDVAPRDMCLYVILCEKDGRRVWCHCANVTIQSIAEKIREDASQIAPLR